MEFLLISAAGSYWGVEFDGLVDKLNGYTCEDFLCHQVEKLFRLCYYE